VGYEFIESMIRKRFDLLDLCMIVITKI